MRLPIAAGSQRAFALSIVFLSAADLRAQAEALTAALVPDELVARGATWRFFRGVAEPSGGSLDWTEPGFDDGARQAGAAGFGYADGDDVTVLSDMSGGYSTLHRGRMDSEVNISDPVHLLLYLFAGGEAPTPDGAHCFGEEL